MTRRTTLTGGRAGKPLSAKTKKLLTRILEADDKVMDISFAGKQLLVCCFDGTLITMEVDATQ